MTFLFADVRGFRLPGRDGGSSPTGSTADYLRLLQDELTRAGAGEIKTEGDGFYVMFRSARAALECALTVLRFADDYSRQHASDPVHIAVGMHAGEIVPHVTKYESSIVLAARLARSAAPGELLLSDVVRGLIPKSALPSMSERKDLALEGVEDAPRVLAVAWRESRRRQHALKTGDESAALRSRRILSPDLVGREDVLDALSFQLTSTIAGHGRIALLTGNAGIGKSACLRRFLERARATGARSILGECTEIEATRPFGAFIDAFSSAGVTLPKEVTEGSPDPQVAALERYRVHAGLTRALIALAGRAPLVVAIEDVQWADEATLELIVYLSKKLREHRVLLLLTYRSDELHRTHPLGRTLASLTRSRLASEVKIGPLSEAETAIVVRGALGLDRVPAATFRNALHERCEGNPFFIEEVLRALAERGDLIANEGAWSLPEDVTGIVMPLSIRETVEERLRALAPTTRRVLHVAAVIGQSFDFELLRTVAKVDDELLIAALRAAIDAQLIVEESAPFVEARFRFRHALTREAVLLELLERERRQIHGLVAEALETRAAPLAANVAEELAYHFDEARDADRAFRYRQLAANEAIRVMAFAKAIRHLDRAIALAPRGDPIVGELYLRLAEAAAIAPDLPRAVHAAEEARRSFEAAGLPLRVGAAVTRVAAYQWFLGSAESLARAGEAVRILEPHGETTELAAACAELARQEYLNCQHSSAEQWVARAIEIARAAGSEPIEIEATATLGGILLDLRKPEGMDLKREALKRAVSAGLVATAHRIYYNLEYYLQGTWAADEARQHHEAWTRYGQRSGASPDVLTTEHAMFALIDADFDRVEKLVDDLLESRAGIIGRLHKLFVRVAREGPGRGKEHAAAVHQEMQRAGAAAASHRAQWATLLAEIDLLSGDAPAALTHAHAATQIMAPLWAPWMECPAALAIGLLSALKLDDREAVEQWSALINEADHPEDIDRPAWELAEAERLVASGQVDAASAHYRRSGQLFRDAFPLIWTAIELRHAEVRARVSSVEREGAAAGLGNVLAYWRKAKAAWYLGEIDRWAKATGLDLISDEADSDAAEASTGVARLTAREQEVADLVSQGLTNREIAERLVLSERTVEGHVERILGKLGFRSRTQIAAWRALEAKIR